MSGIRFDATSFPSPRDFHTLSGDDWSGYGRKQEIVTGREDYVTICEARLEQRSQYLEKYGQVGTDAPHSNLIYIGVEPYDISVSVRVVYGSGSGNDDLFLTVATGTAVFVPATYWRVDARVNRVSLGGEPAYPPLGTRVMVSVTVGRGTGSVMTRPELTIYGRTQALGTQLTTIPKRTKETLFHLYEQGNISLVTLRQLGFGGNRIAEWGPPLPLTQDQVIPIFAGANQFEFVSGPFTSRYILNHRLT